MLYHTYMVSASAIHEIMGAAKMGSVTAKQADTIADYSGRETLTDNQEKELARLIAKRDAKPELPVGAKTHCKKWLKTKIYGREKSFSSVQTDKGNIVEDEAIKLIGEHLERPFMVKEDEAPANDGYIKTRGCDVLERDSVGDNKSSWDFDTFPLFQTEPEKGHKLQVNGYLSIFDRPMGWVAYTLMDAPGSIVHKLTEWECRDLGIPYDLDVFDKIKDHYTYSDYAIELRVKVFWFDRDDALIKAIHDRVELCRDYIKTLELKLIADGKLTNETKTITLPETAQSKVA